MHIQIIPKSLHTVPEGLLKSVESFTCEMTGENLVEILFRKCTPKLFKSGQCFDDNPSTAAIENQYHYNQKQKNSKLM